MFETTIRIGNKNYEVFGTCMRDVEVFLIFTKSNRAKARVRQSSLFITQNCGRIEEALIAAKESYRAA